MEKNSVISTEYPTDWRLEIPVRWILVAEDLLDEAQYLEWLYKITKFLGLCGMDNSDDATVDMLLQACYNEELDEEGLKSEYIDRYFKSILYKRQPTVDKLKVMRAWDGTKVHKTEG